MARARGGGLPFPGGYISGQQLGLARGGPRQVSWGL